jgi:hypothetical protein
MTEAAVSFAGNLTDDPELRHTEAGIARAMFRVAASGRREQEPSFFTVVVWRDQAEHAAQSLSKGSRVVVVGRLQQRAWTGEDGSAPWGARSRWCWCPAGLAGLAKGYDAPSFPCLPLLGCLWSGRSSTWRCAMSSS